MKVWLVKLGEPLPVDGNRRLHRYGILAEMLSQKGHEVTWWTSTFDHWDKKQRFETDKALLYKIAGDLFVSHTRRERLRREAPVRIHFELSDNSPEDQLQYHELQDKYEDVLMKLPENQRITFLMSRTEELSYQEIATRLSISVKAVEKRISGALSRLRKELKT